MQIQILGTGCARCKKLEENAQAAAEAMGVDAEIAKVTALDQIMEYGVMATPALAIDGRVKVSGRVAEPKEIMAWIKEAQA